MKPTACLACLLAAALVGCTPTVPGPDVTIAPSSTAAPFVTSVSGTTMPEADPLAARVAASGERWLAAGYACFCGEMPLSLDIKAFLAEPTNRTRLALYDDFFCIAEADGTLTQVAGYLFTFIVEQYGADALFDVSQRTAYKDAFVKSVDPALSYANAFETIGAAMDCRLDAAGKCIITLEGAEYAFSREMLEKNASSVHSLIYYNILARRQLIDRLRELDPAGEIFSLDGTLYYDMVLGGGASSTDLQSRVMTVNHFSAMLHETVHALGLFPKTVEERWFVEGLCEYFGKALDFDLWLNLGEWQETAMALQGKLDSLAAQPQWARRIAAAEHYAAAGGDITSAERFSMAAMLHAKAWVDLTQGADETLGDVFMAVNGKPYSGPGGELSYAGAASMVLYLVERDGIEALLALYKLGKAPDFAGTYAAWEGWLTGLAGAQ